MADLKAYWQELAKSQGLSDEETSAVLQALGNEKVSKAFQSGFVERPVFSSELDKTRNEWKSKVDQYQTWYEKTAMPAHQQAVQAVELLGKYQQQYGALDGTNKFEAATGMTQEQITKMLDERSAQQNQAYMRVVKAMTKAAGDYQKRFGEVLDVDAFEDFAVKRGGDPLDAYQAYIAPKVQESTAQAEAKRAEEVEAKIKAAREEGARDALSKRGLPLEAKTEPSMMRNYMDKTKEEIAKSERSGRDSFMEAYNTYQEPSRGAA